MRGATYGDSDMNAEERYPAFAIAQRNSILWVLAWHVGRITTYKEQTLFEGYLDSSSSRLDEDKQLSTRPSSLQGGYPQVLGAPDFPKRLADSSEHDQPNPGGHI
ncbi:hypothetical protein LshimejAT787_2100850 [Lyophyllum shimeji]|uniref:Uncharacterized protein n=1 Tax=Lyophyllum shimeji TaxID=47721 RepID=A0A9P3UV06_LYOSH|nr:hypothetical protein LshimejAT787_2100850 [Lyophyllum shimeji]